MDKIFAIIDIETTGGRAATEKITEIAIVLHDGQKIIGQYETLINPERHIPYGITELTGITDEMVADAPKFYEVAKKIVEMTEGAVFVAHNVRFDYSFVQEEFRRLGYTYTRKKLCTVRLSRKTFPGLPSYSLGNLIRHFKLNVGARHRAMGDTMATVDLFERILAAEKTEENISEMINLGVRESLLPKSFSMEKIHALPEACGVYYFHDEKGDVVYVGKSLNIKKRVAEHFAVKTEKARKLQAAVHDVSYEITGSELAALLYESHEIKRLRPSINRAQKTRQFPYVIHAFENSDGYLCFEVKKENLKTRKALRVVASYPKQANAKSWLRNVQKQYQLCLRHCHLEIKNGPCFDYHLSNCFGACIGEEAPEDYNERANEAMEALDENFLQPNFFLIDKGRNENESTVILVEEGEYRGFGYAELNELNGQVEELRDVVKFYENNPEVMRILQGFIAKGKGLKMLPF
ncbi:MAG TPA: DNA polymerase III subunit epsilon [Bacteroidetes bacterium]|nr:DNA polymerase III subunit epsilon [Bacteroidota bacterium]